MARYYVLLLLVLLGSITGLAVGVIVSILTPEAALISKPQGFEHKTLTRWQFKRVSLDGDPNKFEYSLVDQPYTFQVPVGGVPEKDTPVWQDMIQQDIDEGNFSDVFRFIEGIRNPTEQTDALLFAISGLAGKPPPGGYVNDPRFPSSVPALNPRPWSGNTPPPDNDSSKEDARIRQQKLAEFVEETTEEVGIANALAKKVDDPSSRARVLMRIASIQRSLADDVNADKTIDTARASFVESQNNQSWNWVLNKITWLLIGVGAVAGTIIWAVCKKIFGDMGDVGLKYVIELIVQRVGDKTLAKAAGTELDENSTDED